MIYKIIGAACLLLGLLIVIFFPWIHQYQFEGITKAGILFGLILMAIGFYLMKI